MRAWANAALRLGKALEVGGTGEEPWLVLVLVAHYIVFNRAGSGLNPLYNHLDGEVRSTREREAHRDLCDALRAELSALGGA